MPPSDGDLRFGPRKTHSQRNDGGGRRCVGRLWVTGTAATMLYRNLTDQTMQLENLFSDSSANVFRDFLDQTAGALQNASYVEEWLGPRQRLPIFDVQVFRDFASDSANLDRLAQLLASYVRIASGSIWWRSGGRWRRRRYSELNPLDLAELGNFGRLGDLALFMSG